LGCFSIVDAVATIVCSAGAVGCGSASSNTYAYIQREMQYRCSVDSGRVNNSTYATFAQWLVDSISDIGNA